MHVAVVILNWNSLGWLQRCLQSALANSDGAEVIVADNASSDGSMTWLRERHPDVRTIELPTNMGFAGGYNTALAQVEADRYVLLNPDVEVPPGWLGALNARLDAEPGMAACQPKVHALSDPGRFEHAGAAGGYIDRNGYPFCRGRIFEITEADNGQYDDDHEVFWATGACLMIRAVAFREVGGFDADLFAHMEEIDLCWRLKRRGWRIGHATGTTVRHAGGGSLGYGSPLKTYLNFRNSLIVLAKNTRQGPLWRRIPHRLLLDWFAAMKFLAEGHARHAWQVLRAHAHFVSRFGTVLRQRRTLMAEERDPDLTGLYTRSIAFDRFILGWKRFSQLDVSAFVQRR